MCTANDTELRALVCTATTLKHLKDAVQYNVQTYKGKVFVKKPVIKSVKVLERPTHKTSWFFYTFLASCYDFFLYCKDWCNTQTLICN